MKSRLNKKKILLVENFSADFYKARLPFAKLLLEEGYDVYVLIPDNEFSGMIEKEGVKTICYPLDRRNKGVLQILQLVKIYRNIIKTHNFYIIHSFRFQPNLLNVLANFFNSRIVILHITGLGITFSNRSPKFLILRSISQLVYQLKLFRANEFIVQNDDDKNDIWFNKFWENKVRVIYGSGVNTSFFDNRLFDRPSVRRELKVSEKDLIFICVTRLLWEKGIAEMVEAFLTVEAYKKLTLWIVGWSDFDNPRAVPEDFINKYKDNKRICFLGRRDNIRELLAAADVFVYPTYYREGIPRGILEAMSMSLPIITTDTPGCRLTVEEGRNGYLIMPRSSSEIKGAVDKFIVNTNGILDMRENSRMRAQKMFAEEIVFNSILDVYKKYISVK